MRKHGLQNLATLAALMLAATQGVAQEGEYADASITLPPQGGLVQLRVVAPERAEVGQAFNYRLEATNTSDNVILHEVIISQTMSSGFTIEDSQLAGAQGQAQDRRNRQQQDQARNQPQRDQQRRQAAYRQQQGEQQQGRQRTRQSGQRDWQQIGQGVYFSQGQSQAGDKRESRWFIGQLEPGETKSIVVRGTSDEQGTGYNCLAVTSYTPVLCLATEFVQPDVVLAKEAPQRANLCEPAVFQYRITNDGDGVAENVVIRDELPTGLKTREGEDVVSINVGVLDPGQTEAFRVPIVASETGTFGSRAVALREGETVSRSGQPQTRFVLADLNVSIDGPSSVYIDRLMEYTITVANRGDAPAVDAELRLNTPDTAEFLRLRHGNEVLTAEESDVDAQNVGGAVWSLGTLDPGESTNVSVTLRAQRQGQHDLVALATAVCADDDAQQRLQARASTPVEVIALPALLLTAVDNQDPVRVGEDVIYDIIVINQGQAADQNVQVTAELPQELEFVSADGPTEVQSRQGQLNFGTIRELGPGERAEWQVRARGTSDADVRLRVELTSNYLDEPVTAEEPTRLFGRQGDRRQGDQQQRRQQDERQQQRRQQR